MTFNHLGNETILIKAETNSSVRQKLGVFFFVSPGSFQQEHRKVKRFIHQEWAVADGLGRENFSFQCSELYYTNIFLFLILQPSSLRPPTHSFHAWVLVLRQQFRLFVSSMDWYEAQKKVWWMLFDGSWGWVVGGKK